MFRFLRVALVAFLVPVVVFANPQTAAAAGPWSVVSIGGIGVIPGVSCTFSMQQFAAGQSMLNVGGNGYCIGLPDQSPGFTQDAEANSGFAITATGLNEAGASCSGTYAGTLGAHARNGTMRVAGSIPASVLNTSSADCSIKQVCIQLRDNSGCTTVDIPALVDEPPSAESECDQGTPMAYETRIVETVHPTLGEPYRLSKWQVRVLLSSALPFSQWGVATYWKNTDGSIMKGWSKAVVTGGWQDLGPTIAWHTNTPVVYGNWIKEFGGEVYAEWPQTGGGTPWNPLNPHNSGGQQYATVFPPGKSDYYGGFTDTPHCRFWFGPKVVDWGGGTGDEPFAQPNTLPEPPPTDPEPVLDDPDNYEEPETDLGWLALIWALLKSILAVISNLASAIINGIINGIKGLFIPDTDNWGVAELVDQLKLKPPFSLLVELEDESRAMGESYRSGGSCGVIADFGNGGVLSCSTIANVPGFSGLYSLVSAGLMGLTGWGMFLMVSRLFEQGQ